MNFTREPIIETIITPKDGYKLIVRNSKGGGLEEYSVDAVEVVSFGHSFFFRSLERPKSFLVPVSDYEVVETKETRIALKNVPYERAIKIGGGRAPKEREVEKEEELISEEEEVFTAEAAPQPAAEHRQDKKGRRRHRRRRSDERHEPKEWQENKSAEQPGKQADEAEAVEGGGSNDETKVSSSTFSKLFPPPTTLISETIARYKDLALSEGTILPKPVEEKDAPVDEHKSKKKEEKPHDENEDVPESDTTHLSRSTFAKESESQLFRTSSSFTPPFGSDTWLF